MLATAHIRNIYILFSSETYALEASKRENRKEKKEAKGVFFYWIIMTNEFKRGNMQNKKR